MYDCYLTKKEHLNAHLCKVYEFFHDETQKHKNIVKKTKKNYIKSKKINAGNLLFQCYAFVN